MTADRHVRLRPHLNGQAIAWIPLDDGHYLLASVMTSARAAPLVVLQRVLLAVDAHLRSVPHRDACGILSGVRYADSRTGEEYVLAETVTPGPNLDSADRDGSFVAALNRLVSHAERDGRLVLGWYRGNVMLSPRPSLAGVDEILRIFPHRWQVGLVRQGQIDAQAGAFVRIEPGSLRTYPIPFTEMVPAESVRGAELPTGVQWPNYRTEMSVAPLSETAVHSADTGVARGTRPATRNSNAPQRPGLFAGLFRRPPATDVRPFQRPHLDTRTPPVAQPVAPPVAQPVAQPAPPPPQRQPPPQSPARTVFVESASAAEPAPDKLPPELEQYFRPLPVARMRATAAAPVNMATESEVPQVPHVEPELQPRTVGPTAPAIVAPASSETIHEDSVDDTSVESRPEPVDTTPDVPPATAFTPPPPEFAFADIPVTSESSMQVPAREFDAILTELRLRADLERLPAASRRRRLTSWVRRIGVLPVAVVAAALVVTIFVALRAASVPSTPSMTQFGQLDSSKFVGTGDPQIPLNGVGTSEAMLTPEQLGKARFALARVGTYGNDLALTLNSLDSVLAVAQDSPRHEMACARADSLTRKASLTISMLDGAQTQVAELIGSVRLDWIDDLITRARGVGRRVAGSCN